MPPAHTASDPETRAPKNGVSGQKTASGIFLENYDENARPNRIHPPKSHRVARVARTKTVSGAVYYGLRYYSPRIGRFLNQDPIGESGGLNLYAFVRNSPVNTVDVLGLWDRVDEVQDGNCTLYFEVTITGPGPNDVSIRLSAKSCPGTYTVYGEKIKTPQDLIDRLFIVNGVLSIGDGGGGGGGGGSSNGSNGSGSSGVVQLPTMTVTATKPASNTLNAAAGNSGAGISGNVSDATIINNVLRGLNNQLKKSLCATFLDKDNDIYDTQEIYDGKGFKREYAVSQGLYTGDVPYGLKETSGPLIYMPDDGMNALEYDERHKTPVPYTPPIGAYDALFYVKPGFILNGIASPDRGSQLNLIAAYQFHSHPIHRLGENALSNGDVKGLDELSAATVLGGAFNGNNSVFSGYYNKQQFSRTFDEMRTLLGCPERDQM